MPQDWPSTICLILITLLALVAKVASVQRLRGRGETGSERRIIERVCTGLAAVVAFGVLCYRAVVVSESWALLEAHVDGLLLLIAVLCVVVSYIQWTKILRGVEMFLLPVLVVLSGWAVCASWWTLRPFNVGAVWNAVHIVSVYLGITAVTMSAAIAGLYLYVRHQLKRRDNPADALKRLGKLASLETLDAAIVRFGTLGFILISLALVTGFTTELTSETPTAMGAGWWYSPKVIGSAVAWLIYAAVTHVRYVPTVRGRRAAWLLIIGFVLLLAVLAIAATLPGCQGTSGSMQIGSDAGLGVNVEVGE